MTSGVRSKWLELRLVLSAGKLPMSSVRQEFLKRRPADTDQAGVVAIFNVDVGFHRQTVVYEDLERVRGPKRRHGAWLAITKKGLEFFLIGHADMAAK
jgi:hypothetical protein